MASGALTTWRMERRETRLDVLGPGRPRGGPAQRPGTHPDVPIFSKHVLTVITAAITSAFIESARRRLAGTETDGVAAKLDQIAARLDAIEAGLKNIGGHKRDAPQ